MSLAVVYHFVVEHKIHLIFISNSELIIYFRPLWEYVAYMYLARKAVVVNERRPASAGTSGSADRDGPSDAAASEARKHPTYA